MKTQGAETGAGPLQVRRGLWRRAARRGKDRAPRSASSRCARAEHRWDPQEPAARTVAALQHAQASRRELPRVSAVQLDRNATCGTTSRRRTFRSCRSISPRSVRSCGATASLIMRDDERMKLRAGRAGRGVERPLPHARLLSADRRRRERRQPHSPEIIAEMRASQDSASAQGRIIDHDGSASMEQKKQEGYF